MRRKHRFICPNDECRKGFDKPIMLTDTLSIPRQTYYACPYCKSKLEIVVENEKVLKIVSLKKAEGTVLTASADDRTPKNCPFHFGFLSSLPKNCPVPDECLTCPKIIQCSVRRD
ncbi:MAG TPA: hypothetical protein ENF76_00465 [Candidatus Bathyarchaeota archaeon]|nr:hypothetical protein [Candidatus Bathyarchaeota archaeon]